MTAPWRKLGLVWGPDGSMSWARNSCLTPTPVLMGDVIRVYCGFRDDSGVSRIGFVDVSATDPTRVLRVSDRPALDVGRPGCFDDNGVILGDVIRVGDSLRMYYVGFQLVGKVKFLAFTGCAVSEDEGNTFHRLSEVPVLDRADEGRFIRAIHTVRFEDGKWRAWYAAGSGWEHIGGQPYPQYHIRTLDSADGLTFGKQGQACLPALAPVYRIGRPRVYTHAQGGYSMFFTYGTTDGSYLPGAAKSADGVVWERDDSLCGLSLSDTGWDSRHVCYPALIEADGRRWAFYNGNDMGRDGFGCAEVVDE